MKFKTENYEVAIFERRRNIHSNELTPSWYLKYFISIAYMTSFVIWVTSMSMTSLALTQLKDATHVFPGSQTCNLFIQRRKGL